MFTLISWAISMQFCITMCMVWNSIIFLLSFLYKNKKIRKWIFIYSSRLTVLCRQEFFVDSVFVISCTSFFCPNKQFFTIFGLVTFYKYRVDLITQNQIYIIHGIFNHLVHLIEPNSFGHTFIQVRCTVRLIFANMFSNFSYIVNCFFGLCKIGRTVQAILQLPIKKNWKISM